MATPEQLRIDANDMTFGALAWGDPEAPLALLIHGYPDTAWTWRHLGPFLEERGWRAVAPFTRGYAPTDLAPDDSYLVADQAADVLALHSALRGDANSVLIGHDWGAQVVWAITTAEPARFARYVALAAPPPAIVLELRRSIRGLGIALRQTRMSWYVLYNQLPAAERALDKVIPKLWRDWSPGYDASEDLAHVFEALNTPARRRAALRYYRNNMQKGLKALISLSCGAPVLYVLGEDDGCVHVQAAAAYADRLVESSGFEVVAGVGHFLQLEDPARVNRLIGDWIGAAT